MPYLCQHLGLLRTKSNNSVRKDSLRHVKMDDYVEFSVDCSDPAHAIDHKENSLVSEKSVSRPCGPKLPRDKNELWTSGEYKIHRWRCDSDYLGSHPRGKIFSLADAPEVLKIVVWRGFRDAPRPLPDSLVRFETREVTSPDTLEGFLESPRKKIDGYIVDSRQPPYQLASEQHIIVYSMTPGERCIARISETPPAPDCAEIKQTIDGGAKYRYFIFDLLNVWKRTMLCPSPHLLAIQIPHGKLALAESPHGDSRIEIHFSLYKRAARDNPGSTFLDPSDPSWELVLNTRERSSRKQSKLDNLHYEITSSNDSESEEPNLVSLAPKKPSLEAVQESTPMIEEMAPLRLTLGQGTIIPGLEYALLNDGSILETPGGQLFCSPFWVSGSLATNSLDPSQRFNQLDAMECVPQENYDLFEALDLSRFKHLDIFDKWELLFDNLQVYSFTTRRSDWCFDTLDERLKEAVRLRELGNEFMKRESYKRAFERYERGYRLLADDKRLIELNEPAEVAEVIKLHLNSAYSLMRQQAYDGAILFLDEVLSVQPQNMKALYRKAVCYERIDRIFDALRIAEVASLANPDNNDIRRLMEHLRRGARVREQASSFTTALKTSKRCPWEHSGSLKPSSEKKTIDTSLPSCLQSVKKLIDETTS